MISVTGVVVSVKEWIGTMVTSMDAELFEWFIPHILSDLAERRTDSGEYLPRGQRRWMLINGQRRRVFVYGDHVCYQNGKFHDSDSEYRLTLAVAAAEMIEQERLGGSRGSNAKACLRVAESLLNSSCERFKSRFLRSDQHTQTQGSVSALRESSEPPFLRLSDTIRRQVNRYRRRHLDWRRDFDFQVAQFRSQFRDREWYREAEAADAQWLGDFEKRQNFEWFEAMKIVAMARLYQDQDQFDRAITIYQKAILFARKAHMDEEFRRVVLLWLGSSVRACLRGTHSLPDPGYSGPRISIH
jgi:hypothetical protein